MRSSSRLWCRRGWDAVLKEAKEAKIPVVLLDRDIDPSGKDLYLTAVTSDSVHEGEVAGDWLAKTVGGKACNVVELQGTVGASVATNRKKGFDTAIAKHAEHQGGAQPDRRLHPRQGQGSDGKLHQGRRRRQDDLRGLCP